MSLTKNEYLMAKVVMLQLTLCHTNQFNITINLSNCYEMPVNITFFKGTFCTLPKMPSCQRALFFSNKM